MSEIVKTIERGDRTIHVYDNGMEKDAATGQMVKPPPHALITPETSQAMLKRRREIGILAQLKALAKSNGETIDDDDSLEEIARKAASAAEAVTLHMIKTFKESENLRGMGETYTKIMAPLLGEPGSQRTPDEMLEGAAAIGAMLLEYARRAGLLEGRGEVVEGQEVPAAIPSHAPSKFE